MPLIHFVPASSTGGAARWTTRPSSFVDMTPVAALPDVSGHARTMVQASSAAQPIADAQIVPGVTMLRCDAGQYMSSAGPTLGQVKDIFMVVYVPGGATTNFTVVARTTSAATTKSAFELAIAVS